MQRFRLRFSRGEELKYLSHLDIIRLWHRALRRAGMEPAYSEGFTPHPKIFLAAPLPLGVTGEAELADVVFDRTLDPELVVRCLNACLPAGLHVEQAMQVSPAVPPLQARMSRAEYAVTVSLSSTMKELEASIERFLSLDKLPWSHMRQAKTLSYDLRSLVQNIWIESKDAGGYITLGMLLECSSKGSARPEQVVKALGMPEPESIHRRRLMLENV